MKKPMFKKGSKRCESCSVLLCIICVAVLVMSLLTGCQKNHINIDSSMSMPSLSPSPLITQTTDFFFDTTINPSTTTSPFQSYKGDYIEFEYPSSWKAEIVESEDQFTVNFVDLGSHSEPLFWYTRGVAIDGDGTRTEDDYLQLIERSFETLDAIRGELHTNLQIESLAKVTLDGIEGDKLAYSYILDDVKWYQFEANYVDGYTFVTLNMRYPNDLSEIYHSVFDDIVASVKLK